MLSKSYPFKSPIERGSKQENYRLLLLCFSQILIPSPVRKFTLASREDIGVLLSSLC